MTGNSWNWAWSRDMAEICCRNFFCSIWDKLLMRSCTNEEPRYFGTKICHVNANAFTIQTMGVYVSPRVPLLIGRCRPSKCVSRREACKQAAAQSHREASPLTRLHCPPSSQLPPLLMASTPQFKITPALPDIATIFCLPLRFSCRLPPTSLT